MEKTKRENNKNFLAGEKNESCAGKRKKKSGRKGKKIRRRGQRKKKIAIGGGEWQQITVLC